MTGRCRDSRGCLWRQVGAFEKDPQKVAQLVRQWVARAAARPDSEFYQMVKRAKALGTPESLTRICKDLVRAP